MNTMKPTNPQATSENNRGNNKPGINNAISKTHKKTPRTQTMDKPLISQMRQTSAFMRSISASVLFTFSLMILQPTLAIAQDALKNPAATNASTSASSAQTTSNNSAESQFGQTLEQIETQLETLENKLETQQNSSSERSQLKQLKKSLKKQAKQVHKNFKKIEQHILDHELNDVIMARHQAMVSHYQQELDTLMTELDGVDSQSDDSQRMAHTKKAMRQLKAQQKKRAQQPFDPNNLPNSSLKPNANNQPKLSAEEFAQAGLHNSPYTQLAALGDFTFDKLNGANNPAYLAASTEITLSQAIQDQAASLNHDPVKIYHWVRNNIEWQPTWGGIQDADLTLAARRGNAMDISSLTIALLRAAQIPARYVHGTIDVPAEAFKNWAGGFTDSTAAANFASSGGIPTTIISTGGQISTIRIEHLWVEAAIDFQPSRGAKNKAADTWVPLDPSYKQYDYLPGLDVLQISGIDPEQLAQSFIDSGTINENEGWVTGFDPAILQAAQSQAQQKLEEHIENNLTAPTVGDVIGGRRTIIKEYPTLPSGLANKIITTGSRYDQLPSQLQQTITWALNRGISGALIDPVSFPFAQVNNQKITLSFKPATEADEQALLSLLPEGEITDISQLPTSIPSHLVSVVPELKLNGQIIRTGAALQLGEEIPFTTATSFAGRGQVQAPRTYHVIAGSYLVVNAVAGSVSPETLRTTQSKLENTKGILETMDQAQIGALTRQELLGDMFHAGGLAYYTQLTVVSNIIGISSGAHHTLVAGTGTFGYEPYVDYFFGFPRAINAGGIALDIPLVNTYSANDGNANKQKLYTLQVGIFSSALEHAVLEQMFATQDLNDPQPDAISAVKALQKASLAGQRIYHIDQSNQSTVLANISHDQSIMDEFRNALNSGKEIITHVDKISVPGWSGVGYIIIDPQTGDGAYKISGGGNGGFVFWFAVVLGIAAMFALVALGGFIPILLAFILLYEYVHFINEIQELAASDISDEQFTYLADNLIARFGLTSVLALLGAYFHFIELAHELVALDVFFAFIFLFLGFA